MLRPRLVKITGKRQRKLPSSSSARLLNNVLQGRAGIPVPPRKRKPASLSSDLLLTGLSLSRHITLGDSWLWGFQSTKNFISSPVVAKCLSSHVKWVCGVGVECHPLYNRLVRPYPLSAHHRPNRQKKQAKTPSRIVFRNPLNPVQGSINMIFDCQLRLRWLAPKGLPRCSLSSSAEELLANPWTSARQRTVKH
jgi:hypothetical protein